MCGRLRGAWLGSNPAAHCRFTPGGRPSLDVRTVIGAAPMRAADVGLAGRSASALAGAPVHGMLSESRTHRPGLQGEPVDAGYCRSTPPATRRP
jgi:hypothetical protein